MMKIQGKCDTCDRAFLLSQIGPDSDAPGRCPFCGARFARHYNNQLVETVAEVEKSADRFFDALKRLQTMETGFAIDHEGLTAEVVKGVREHDKHLATG